ncbi:hypothetical protein OGAPHI_007095 [Ogataea philodendri]|uniref:25S rRNA adenine-N(1) methyltransferase n=1 Tax=Ogataea philodendri TaxID=1378263 RepID=A0A9P8NWT2_9ASCO|nr:uncharacterized protein OGAPHI_007095 [Ogataea philodendri]KAH3660509.1 hypothetical protein OGAPHI_007095 [Ogataea philodendri]
MLKKRKGLLATKRQITLKPLRARQLIRRFHVLLKNKTQLAKFLEHHWKCTVDQRDVAKSIRSHDPKLLAAYEENKIHIQKVLVVNKTPSSEILTAKGLSVEQVCSELGKIDGEIEKRGGLETYQAASTQGQSLQRGGDSSKKLVQWLKELGYSKENAVALEIGCLHSRNAISTCGLFKEVVKIDLHSQEPEIIEQDFMQRPLPKSSSDKFDLISCSLVVNFVPDADVRGEMMVRITQFLKDPATKPYLFFVLPLPCITNSRYFDNARLSELTESLGFECVKHHESHKLAYYLYKRTGVGQKKIKLPKKELHKGANRNNFCIVMR